MAMVGNTDTRARNSNTPLPLLRVGRSGGRSHLSSKRPSRQNHHPCVTQILSNQVSWRGRSTGWPNRTRLPKASITPVSSAPDRRRVGSDRVWCSGCCPNPVYRAALGSPCLFRMETGLGAGPSRSAGPVVAATQPLAQNTFLTLPNAALPGRLRLRN
jgi:hypothetical protein